MINEKLETEEAKKKWRDLVKKYHTDKETGDEDLIKKINNAKDKGDEALLKMYDEIMSLKGQKNKEEVLNKKENDFFKRTGMTPEQWMQKHEKIKMKRRKKSDKIRKRQRR